LGSLDLRDGEGRVASSVLSQPQLTALLVYLADSEPGSFHRRDTLVGLMWPEAPDDQARHRLRQKLYDLRRMLGEAVLVSRGKDEVGIPVDALHSDVCDFKAAVSDGRWDGSSRRFVLVRLSSPRTDSTMVLRRSRSWTRRESFVRSTSPWRARSLMARATVSRVVLTRLAISP